MSTLYHSDPLPTTPGIYRITCTANGKIYIGSSINLKDRWKRHRNELRCNKHCNSKLQNAWNKYGEQSFIFETLELILIPEMLTAREQYWFDTLKPFDKKGYNIARVAGSALGTRHTSETRAKMSAAQLGNTKTLGMKTSPETKEKLRAIRLGTKVSEETKRKISKAGKGRKQSAEHIRKRELSRGKHILSPEARASISAKNTGRKHPPEVYVTQMKTLIIISPDGLEYTACGIKAFCREHSLDPSALMRVALGQQKSHKGWNARLPD